MVRTANLFAVASTVLLISGLVLGTLFEKTQSMAVTWPGSHTRYAVGYQVPCFGLAGLFAIFACSYALHWIPLSKVTADWHLWLSLLGVIVFGFGFLLLAHVAATGATRQPTQAILFTIAAGLIVGPALFVVGQLVFVIALIGRFALPSH